MAFDFKKVYKEFYQPKKIQILNIPSVNYVAVRGNGDPNEPNGVNFTTNHYIKRYRKTK